MQADANLGQGFHIYICIYIYLDGCMEHNNGADVTLLGSEWLVM